MGQRRDRLDSRLENQKKTRHKNAPRKYKERQRKLARLKARQQRRGETADA